MEKLLLWATMKFQTCIKLKLSPTIHILSEKIKASLKRKLVSLSF